MEGGVNDGAEKKVLKMTEKVVSLWINCANQFGRHKYILLGLKN
jgi:hypothetical protein